MRDVRERARQQGWQKNVGVGVCAHVAHTCMRTPTCAATLAREAKSAVLQAKATRDAINGDIPVCRPMPVGRDSVAHRAIVPIVTMVVTTSQCIGALADGSLCL